MNVCLRVHDEATAAIRVVAADTAVVRLDRQPGKRRRALLASAVARTTKEQAVDEELALVRTAAVTTRSDAIVC